MRTNVARTAEPISPQSLNIDDVVEGRPMEMKQRHQVAVGFTAAHQISNVKVSSKTIDSNFALSSVVPNFAHKTL